MIHSSLIKGIDPTLQSCSLLRGLVPALHLGDLDLPLPARRGVRAQEVEVYRGRIRCGGAQIDINLIIQLCRINS